MTLRLAFLRGGFDKEFARGAIIELLTALGFLHSRGEIVHTGIAIYPDFSPLSKTPGKRVLISGTLQAYLTHPDYLSLASRITQGRSIFTI